MRRFFVPPENVGEDTITIDDKGDLRHMRKVLRLKEGEQINVSDSDEWEYRAQLIFLGEDEARCRILDKQRFSSEPQLKITLFQGISKQNKMETVVQKSVELGVAAVVPVFMARTVVVDKGNFAKKIQRWQRVAVEASKQCRRGRIPQVSEAVRLPEILDMLAKFDLVLFPYENEDTTTIKDVLRRVASNRENASADSDCASGTPQTVAVIIGPEGGFFEEEAEQIVAAGGISVSLGKTILRTETAGITAIAMVMYEFEL